MSASLNTPTEAPRMGIAPLMIAGALIVSVFCVGFVFWAAFAPLESAAIAVGSVKVFSNRKAIQHLEGGIVSEINVRDGDRVDVGDVLVVLDKTQALAASTMQQGRRNSLLAREARLIAQRDNLQRIAFPKELTNEQADPEITTLMETQRATFQSFVETLDGQTGIMNQQISQLRQEIRGLNEQIAAQTSELKIVSEDRDSTAKLLAEGYAQKPRLRQLERDVARLNGSLAQLKSNISSAEQRISEIKLKIAANIRGAREKTLAELQQVQSEIGEATERARSAADIMQRTEIVAPISGVIVSAQVHTLGGVIAPGATLMEIVPDNENLIVEARLNPLDIDVVHPGQSARVNFLAFSQRNSTAVEGKVTDVSADALVDEQQGQTYYLARIEIEEDYRQKLGGAELHPGMQAEVMISTGKRTALDYFIKPVTDSFRRALIED